MKKGVIVFKDRYCSTECTVRNESDEGALLIVSQNQIIPNTFEMKVYPERDFRIAEAVWRTPDEMGVRFLERKPVYRSPTSDKSGWDGVERRSENKRRKGERRSN